MTKSQTEGKKDYLLNIKEILIKPEDRILEAINVAEKQLMEILYITIPENIQREIVCNSPLDKNVDKTKLSVKEIFGRKVKIGKDFSITLKI